MSHSKLYAGHITLCVRVRSDVRYKRGTGRMRWMLYSVTRVLTYELCHLLLHFRHPMGRYYGCFLSRDPQSELPQNGMMSRLVASRVRLEKERERARAMLQQECQPRWHETNQTPRPKKKQKKTSNTTFSKMTLRRSRRPGVMSSRNILSQQLCH